MEMPTFLTKDTFYRTRLCISVSVLGMSLALFMREKHFTVIKNDLFLKTPFKPSQVGYLVVTNKYV